MQVKQFDKSNHYFGRYTNLHSKTQLIIDYYTSSKYICSECLCDFLIISKLWCSGKTDVRVVPLPTSRVVRRWRW